MLLLAQTAVETGAITSGINMELLKLLAAVLALVVSTVTIQFKIADFINKKRDGFPNRRVGRLSTAGEIYDWCWGYFLGIAINGLFAYITWRLKDELGKKELDQFILIGWFVFIGYVGNTALWVGGLVIDFLRLISPGPKRPTDNSCG